MRAAGTFRRENRKCERIKANLIVTSSGAGGNGQCEVHRNGYVWSAVALPVRVEERELPHETRGEEDEPSGIERDENKEKNR